MPGRSPHIAGSPSTYLRAGNLRGASPPPTNTTSALRHAQSRRRRPRSPPPDRRSRHQGGSIPMSTSGSIPVSAKGRLAHGAPRVEPCRRPAVVVSMSVEQDQMKRMETVLVVENEILIRLVIADYR